MAKKKTKSQPKPADDNVLFNLLDSKIEIPLGLLRQKHIFIATLLWWTNRRAYFRSMMRLAILCISMILNIQ